MEDSAYRSTRAVETRPAPAASTSGHEKLTRASLRYHTSYVTPEIQPAGPDDGPWLGGVQGHKKSGSCTLATWPALAEVSREAAALSINSPWLDLEHPMTGYEWFKVFAMLPVILIRLLITIVVLPLVYLYTWAVLGNWPLNEPLPEWRKRMLLPTFRFWAGVLIRIGFNIWPVYKGLEHISEAEQARAIVVYNHVSYSDVLVLAEMMTPCGLAKATVAKIPFFGLFARGLQFLFVERTVGDRSLKLRQVADGVNEVTTTNRIHERAADFRYPLFAIAPEGTTKAADCLLTFSTGAFVGGGPVLPVLFRYKARHFHLGWGRVQSTLWHFLRLQTQFNNFLEVEVLPVYYPSEQEKANPRLYADNVRRLMADKLGYPLSPQGLPQWMILKQEGICTDFTGTEIIVNRSAAIPELDALRKEQ